MFPDLNLPKAEIQIKDGQIWDRLRKKYLKCTPEEWVRQNFISFLIDQLNFPEGRMVSEYKVVYNNLNKRCDIAVFDGNSNCQVIVECKAPKIKITEDTFYQIAKYANILKAKLLILSNGLEHYCALINSDKGTISYLQEIPAYNQIEELIG
ncbi:MAG: type I restriction enzyme HsdR N-terminal domain-containing protein [Crocinitomix sp.]|nr:type I restriction enzyme HsdR N-terminal domain-containing protein [Crocinitomix sp.]